MLAWSDLSLRWTADLQALRFADFSAAQGARVLLFGPSGSGKSTLLALLAGLLTPSTGQIQVAGVDLGRMAPAQRDAWRGAHLGLVPQRLHLVQGLTVRENLSLPFVAAGSPTDHRRVEQALAQLDLLPLAQRRPSALSVGQAQRVAIARATLRGPRVLLADEPTAHLDDAHADVALSLLEQAAERTGATLLLSTHDRRLQARWARAQVLELPALPTAAVT